MIGKIKTQEQILEKLGIKELNLMQKEAHHAIYSEKELVLLSPTGTGKTLAFILPIIALLNPEIKAVQALIIVPTRELALQIEQVCRDIGSGFKVNAIYGGRPGIKDKLDLKHPPAILIGTPGRLADRIDRDHFDLEYIKILVLDEFDKSLEMGFDREMIEILSYLPNIEKKILTSASDTSEMPEFVELENPKRINFLNEKNDLLKEKYFSTENTNEGLSQLLISLENARGIVFCNFKKTIIDLDFYLTRKHFEHTCFYGDMEQVDRERSLIKFRNGSKNILLTTDLGARGIDVPELDFIIHYEIPPREHEYLHRNGRTARMHAEGTAYIIKKEGRKLPAFIRKAEELLLEDQTEKSAYQTKWNTIFISGGRKDNISKGDIVGLFIKQGNLENNEIGYIELKQECAFLAVPKEKSQELVDRLNNSKLKKKKVRISILR